MNPVYTRLMNKPAPFALEMTYRVYAVIKGYSDNCTYSGEDFDSLELFFDKEEAELRQIELELEIIEAGRSDYEYVYINSVEVK